MRRTAHADDATDKFCRQCRGQLQLRRSVPVEELTSEGDESGSLRDIFLVLDVGLDGDNGQLPATVSDQRLLLGLSR
jgi:hypothetical protein